MEDVTRLLGEALSGIADTPRTHIVTRKQLSNAVDRMAASLDSLPMDAVDWGIRFAEWRAHAQGPWLTLRKLWRKSVQTLLNLN